MVQILVINAGSSSVKFQLFEIDAARQLHCRIRGQVEGIGRVPQLHGTGADGVSLVDRQFPAQTVPDVPAALAVAGAWLRDEMHVEPVAIGHRVVHGGPDFTAPVRVDKQVLAKLERYIPLAPLHQPHNLAPIKALLETHSAVPQIACFDTAFHRSHDRLADLYALPLSLYDEGVRRYGFHGLSYEYIASVLPKIDPALAGGRVIVAHLGSGASMCAMRAGKSVESTMGFTALDGLPMGTRPGQLDPGVVLYLLQEKGMTPAAVQNFLYHDCGLQGLSGISNDMRDIEASDDPRAALAIDYLAYRIALNAGLLTAALQGLDGFVFTAGIGEHSASLRQNAVARMEWLGLALDPDANARHARVISRPDSRVPVYVIPTDEEAMIAQHSLALLESAGPENCS